MHLGMHVLVPINGAGLRNNCTFCGVFRRQALDRGAVLAGAEKIVTGE